MFVASVVLDLVIGVLSVLGWLLLAFGVGDPDHLAARGMESLKYFTVLSNLFVGIVSVLCLPARLLAGPVLPPWLLALKLAATSAVMITFITVIVLLGPKFGWASMYSGGNLFMHLVTPLVAVTACVLFAQVGRLPVWATIWGTVPSIIYGIWYVNTVRVHGAESAGKVYDFYGFLRWGWSKVPLLAAGMFCASWVISLGLWLASRTFCLMA
jgi:hypothetical protein